MKKLISLIFVVILVMGCFGCGTTVNSSGGTKNDIVNDYKVYDLKNIAYEKTKNAQKVQSGEVGLTLSPIPEYETCEKVAATGRLKRTFPDEKPYFYAIVDWGDGTWSYGGPYKNDSDDKSSATLYHAYKTSGGYSVKCCAVNLSDGKLYGWSEEEKCTVTGSFVSSAAVNKVKPFASSVASGKLVDLLDGKSDTGVKTNASTDSDKEEYIGMFFDDFYRLSSFEVQFPESENFPCNIAAEYTTDGGKTWYSLPKYYYLYDYSVGRYQPIMRFPNPDGATLVFDMDGIVANGIRLSAKLFLSDDRTLSVSDMRAYGDKQLLFYTENGGTYDADLINMWTIYGSAQTEPIVVGSVYSAKTNQSPFRTGFAEILSTEWAEWNGLKFNWSEREDAKEAYLNQLVNIRCGSDGWSGDDGYVWATADSPKHLGEQNHYTLNPIFIIAARNYLLQGNQTIVYENGVEVPFMEATNRIGQTMREKIDKAMNYMLEVLEGKSGIITVYDPENDGTQTGNSSNYWDTHRSFGYKSAYENALFYASLKAMADIEKFVGDEDSANKYLALAEKSRETYNKLFWDARKGRYINSINAKGERIDFGMTVVNYYAVAYGLADEEKAKLIYDWVDGSRIIDGDTSTGKDIYGEFVYASRVNTVDVSTTGEPYYWWDHGGNLPCTPGTFGGYGHQMQNGGTIFYISYYDMMGRLKKLGADSANGRFSVIMNEFHKDSLRRNRYMTYVQNGYQGVGEYSEGVIGEFPESGLVPLTFVTGFLGLNVTPEGLEISPSLPSEYSFAGIREYRFANRVYSVQVRKDINEPTVQYNDEKYFVCVPASGKYVITKDNRLIKA